MCTVTSVQGYPLYALLRDAGLIWNQEQPPQSMSLPSILACITCPGCRSPLSNLDANLLLHDAYVKQVSCTRLCITCTRQLQWSVVLLHDMVRCQLWYNHHNISLVSRLMQRHEQAHNLLK